MSQGVQTCSEISTGFSRCPETSLAVSNKSEDAQGVGDGTRCLMVALDVSGCCDKARNFSMASLFPVWHGSAVLVCVCVCLCVGMSVRGCVHLCVYACSSMCDCIIWLPVQVRVYVCACHQKCVDTHFLIEVVQGSFQNRLLWFRWAGRVVRRWFLKSAEWLCLSGW